MGEGSNTVAKVEKFCCTIEEIAATFRSSFGKPSSSLPQLKYHLAQLNQSLEEDLALSESLTSTVSSQSNITRAAWKALTVLSGQLDLANLKQGEYTVLKKDLPFS